MKTRKPFTDDLAKYEQKYVRIETIYGDTIAGLARYGEREFLECEWGGDEDGLFIEDYLIYNSQIASIEEIEVHGTAELWTERLILRRYRAEDAEPLYQYLGTDPAVAQYSGWNPYATLEMAQETVRRFIAGYENERFYSWKMDVEDAERSYSWVMDIDDVVVGTIGAYDYQDGRIYDHRDDRIEVGFNIVQSWRGRGLATEALRKVLEYLTGNEGISCVTAWCAVENVGSRKVLEKAGMQLVRTEKDGLTVGDRVYDKLMYEYRSDL